MDDAETTGCRRKSWSHAGWCARFQLARGFPKLTVFENLMLYGARQPGEGLLRTRCCAARARRRAKPSSPSAPSAIARRLQLDRVLDNPVTALSGGQKKLLEIGRALMAEPKIILLDEPMAGVNPTLADEIAEHLNALNRDGITICLIEHDMEMIARLCDRSSSWPRARRWPRARSTRSRPTPRVQEAYLGTAALSAARSARVEGVVAGYGAAERDPQGRRSASSRARSSRSSAPTAPASRRCSRPSPACSRRSRAAIVLQRHAT